jgi:hypothetical protein
MPIRPFGVACLVLAMIACDARSPVAPIPQSTTPTAPAVPMGTIRDGQGNPIAGASVNFWPLLGELLTNAAGQFPLPQETIHAWKAGYESSWDDYRTDLTLHEILRIPAGQSVRVTIRPDDSLGGSAPSRVRTVRVFSNGDRIVHIQVLADDNGSVDYMVYGDCSRACSPNPSSFFVEGGGERLVQIQINRQATASRTFTVTTEAKDP